MRESFNKGLEVSRFRVRVIAEDRPHHVGRSVFTNLTLAALRNPFAQRCGRDRPLHKPPLAVAERHEPIPIPQQPFRNHFEDWRCVLIADQPFDRVFVILPNVEKPKGPRLADKMLPEVGRQRRIRSSGVGRPGEGRYNFG